MSPSYKLLCRTEIPTYPTSNREFIGRISFLLHRRKLLLTLVTHIVLGCWWNISIKKKVISFDDEILINKKYWYFIYKLKGKCHFKKHYWGKLNWLNWYGPHTEKYKIINQRSLKVITACILSNENL